MKLSGNENNSSDIRKWLLGNNLGNLLLCIGTFLIGIAASITLWQTSGILDRILKIQSQADKIEVGVQQIKQAVDILRQQLIANHAIQTVQNSPLKNSDATREQIQKIVDTIPNSASCNNPIFLPPERKYKILDQLEQFKTPEAREEILQNALEYKASSPTCFSDKLNNK